jgi:hypothetical protein
MTDLEMDLLIAKGEIERLKTIIKAMTKNKCSFGEGITVKPDGINELDPCLYEDAEIHTNVTVVVKRCTKCGNIELVWHRQEDTEDILAGDWNGH